MKKQNIFLIVSASLLTLLIIIDLVLEFLGISFFFFGKRVFDFLGLFIMLCSICYTVVVFSEMNRRKDRISKNLIISCKIIVSVFTVLLISFGFLMCSFFYEKTVFKDVSEDKRHEVLIQLDSTYGGWNATVYKRYTPFFKEEKKSFYIENMTSQDAEVSVKWYNDSCDITYEYYSDYVNLPEGENTFTQTIYFSDKTVE